MKKEALKSFINLVRRGCIEDIPLINEFPEYIASGQIDAYQYYVNRGLHNCTEPIDQVTICRWIYQWADMNPILKDFIKQNEDYQKQLIGYIMKQSGGRLDPNTVRNIIKQFFEI